MLEQSRNFLYFRKVKISAFGRALSIQKPGQIEELFPASGFDFFLLSFY
jgi:hypothetical protein